MKIKLQTLLCCLAIGIVNADAVHSLFGAPEWVMWIVLAASPWLAYGGLEREWTQ